MERRIDLECLRGIAAIQVFFAHFCQAFLPRFFDSGVTAHGMGEQLIATSGLNLLINANFAVCFFFVLSGYVLSQRNFGHPNIREWGVAMLKRYPRLAIPALVSVLGAWLAVACGAAFYGQSLVYSGATMPDFYHTALPLTDAIRDGAWSPFVLGKSTLNPVLWTMRYELIGSIAVYAYCHLFSPFKARWLIYALCIYVFRDSYYLAFVLGVMLHELPTLSALKKPSKLVSGVLGVAFIIFSSYPYYGGEALFWVLPNAIAHASGISTINVFSHIIGAALLLVLVDRHPALQQHLSGSAAALLGKLSFPIYLVHFPILLTLGAFCVVHFQSLGYGLSLAIAMISCLIAVCFLSYLMLIAVENPMLKALSKYTSPLLRRTPPARADQQGSDAGELTISR